MDKQIQPWKAINKHKIVRNGEAIYEKIKDKLEVDALIDTGSRVKLDLKRI